LISLSDKTIEYILNNFITIVMINTYRRRGGGLDTARHLYIGYFNVSIATNFERKIAKIQIIEYEEKRIIKKNKKKQNQLTRHDTNHMTKTNSHEDLHCMFGLDNDMVTPSP
jgi:hypothetical protein|tara:strand:- start:1941 stop:2276 length:336 start_codon:yes stop_codon:yes gene_type:complete